MVSMHLVKILAKDEDFSFSGDGSDVAVTFEMGAQAGSATACVNVFILDDNELEGNHTITLTIMEDSSFIIIEPSATEILIIDDEGMSLCFS